MPKTTNVFARLEPEVKEQAESVLEQLGIPMSNAIGLFLRQVAMQRCIPFEMKLPPRKPVCMGALTEDELNAEIQKGFDDFEAGRVTSAKRVREEMQRLYTV